MLHFPTIKAVALSMGLLVLAFSFNACKTTSSAQKNPSKAADKSIDSPAAMAEVATADSVSAADSAVTKASEEPVDNTPVPNTFPYHPSRTRYSDLVHTKLYVSFDWKTRTMPGKAYITLEPHFYPTDSLTLDAKGFIVNRVALVKGTQTQDLKYVYTGNKELHIQLDRLYKKGEHYEVFIDYVSQPEKFATAGSAAISSDKGLYFINPDNTEKHKPMQIWTQGETESNSRWFPTIESPNQRQTSEIYMTVNDTMTTLSNGLLVDSHKNADGSRTDHWSQTIPHAPYLVMMTVGHFAEIKDQWHGMQVNYYVEPAYAQYAKSIFGETPAMIEFYSGAFGVRYPWSKYSQVVIRDYVSGAMENTTAVTFLEVLQQDKRAQLDRNYADYICHELSHHWFGDYVTTESWANITLNEGFATYNEYLWFEHRYGKYEADKHLEETLQEYFQDAENKREPLIRYHYEHQEDLFDGHSYKKGGRVIHMLRNEVGDEAFFASLKLYLTRNALHPVEVDMLREAFEEVTGRDLKWFFDQWYLKPGHPDITVSYTDKPEDHQVQVRVQQTQSLKFQPIFELHTQVEITEAGKKRRVPVVVNTTDTTFTFATTAKIENADFDPDKVILAKITESRPKGFWLSQLKLGNNYKQKSDAIAHLAPEIENDTVRAALLTATNDPFWSIRNEALAVLATYSKPQDPSQIAAVKQLAAKDPKSTVRAQAFEYLRGLAKADTAVQGAPSKAELASLFQQAVKDSSYSVVAVGLKGLYATDKSAALNAVQQNMHLNSGEVRAQVAQILFSENSPQALDYVINESYMIPAGTDKFFLYARSFAPYLQQLGDEDQKRAVAFLEDVAQNDPQWFMRLAGARALFSLKDKTEIRDFLKQLKAKETNPQLKQIYDQQMQF